MQNKNEDAILQELVKITKRLDALIALQLLRIKEMTPMREQIKILNQSGLTYLEISAIIGRSPSYVSSELTQIKKQRKDS